MRILCTSSVGIFLDSNISRWFDSRLTQITEVRLTFLARSENIKINIYIKTGTQARILNHPEPYKFGGGVEKSPKNDKPK